MPNLPATFDETTPLPAIIDHAAHVLANARGAAEVLEAHDLAGLAYDAAKRAARIGKAKRAHDDLIAASYRVQSDALLLQSNAKRRLADEYDAAQERGEVSRQGQRTDIIPDGKKVPTVSEIPGLSSKEIHEARLIRDAEKADPGIIERTINAAVEAGEEPTRALLRRAVLKTKKAKRQRKPRFDANASAESQHDRDLRMLIGIWEASCESARNAFLEIVTA
jgi:hypothetical protein